MNRTIALDAAIVALVCCAAGQAAASAHSAPSSQVKPAAPAVESVPSKPVEVKVVSLPPAAPTTVQSSAPFVIHVDKWPEHETDWTAAAVALFTLALAVVTYFLWRSTKALADEARNTSTRQLRAYVFPVRFEKLIGASTKVRVTAKNFGQTCLHVPSRSSGRPQGATKIQRCIEPARPRPYTRKFMLEQCQRFPYEPV